MAERNVLKSNINHPFLVSLHYSFQTKEKLYFVLDFLNGGEVNFFKCRSLIIVFSCSITCKKSEALPRLEVSFFWIFGHFWSLFASVFIQFLARFYAAEIATAIGYLHSCGIIYR
jgi:serine/threonine protein kinase